VEGEDEGFLWDRRERQGKKKSKKPYSFSLKSLEDQFCLLLCVLWMENFELIGDISGLASGPFSDMRKNSSPGQLFLYPVPFLVVNQYCLLRQHDYVDSCCKKILL